MEDRQTFNSRAGSSILPAPTVLTCTYAPESGAGAQPRTHFADPFVASRRSPLREGTTTVQVSRAREARPSNLRAHRGADPRHPSQRR